MNIFKLLKKPRPDKADILTPKYYAEIIISGSGGQGIILAGKILAEAAVIYDQKEAVMTKSYGPEARGGASKAEIIISSNIINYPKVTRPDILVSLNQESMDKYGGELSDGGLLIVDELLVKKIPPDIKNVFKAPFSALAVKLLGTPIVANIISLGSLAAITNLISREALIHSILECVSDKALVSDRVAMDTGFKAVADSKFKWKREGL